MAFTKVASLVTADIEGSSFLSTWRKTPSQATTAGIWFDLTLSPGNPSPQYYAASPLKATTLSHPSDGGLPHAREVSPKKQILRKVMAMTATSTPLPMPMILCDYLMFYPFIDEGTNDEQFMDNTATLPRYTDGAGVQILPVMVAASSSIVDVSFTVNYTNQDGVSGRTTAATNLTIAQTVLGTVGSSAQATAGYAGPFLPLQAGDTGVRSIESVTFPTNLDVGLLTLVLVKPLAQMSIRSNTAPVEVDYFKDFLQAPVIEDGAFLSFICCPSGSLASVAIHGLIETAWS